MKRKGKRKEKKRGREKENIMVDTALVRIE